MLQNRVINQWYKFNKQLLESYSAPDISPLSCSGDLVLQYLSNLTHCCHTLQMT